MCSDVARRSGKESPGFSHGENVNGRGQLSVTTTCSPTEILLHAVFGKPSGTGIPANPIAVPPKAILDEVLETLQPREAQVLRLRFGLDDGVPKSLRQTALHIPRISTFQKSFSSRTGEWVTRTYPQGMPVSRERIRQIEAKALRKLRHPSRSRKLREFLAEA